MGPSMRQTVVFAFDTKEQRDELFEMIKPIYKPLEDGLRVVAMSDDNEVTRVGLMAEVIERYRDRDEIVEAIEALYQCDNLKEWSWSKFECEATP